MRLNLGCGDWSVPDWVNADQHHGPGVQPDVVAHSAHLPFGDGTVDDLYCGHLLEHLPYPDAVIDTLREMRRVLAPDGRVCIVGPDYDKAWENPEWHPLLPGIVFGGHRWPGDGHLWLSSGWKTLAAVRMVFPAAVEVATTSVPTWPLMDTVGWQFAILTNPEAV